MESWQSWAFFLAIAAAAAWYYSQQPKGRQRGRPVQRVANTKTASANADWIESESQQKSSAKAAKAKAPKKSVKKAVQDIGDKAKANLSAASSTTGADGDDDLSPAVSPALGATTAVETPSGRDVSDMLEPRAAAPAVLRVLAPEKPARMNKPQQQRPETPQETKKQRQNKKKVEEAKAQREADEQQRLVLLEKQRRTAREARGEPAKNGIQQAKPPTSNPWSAPRSTGPQNVILPVTDDFNHHEVASTASSSEAATNGTAPTPDSMSGSAYMNNLPSEEEQLRMAMEDSAWTEVPKGRKNRKNKTGEAVGDDTSDSGVQREAPAVKPVASMNAENVKPTSRYELLPVEQLPEVPHKDDSDWPVV
ncbi:hypothetical protein EJ04DRAFT_259127 [Polyplosphaeria fusca]|uniref:Uncharacterized protein n=1 Tax=Polyplosphaeria fusca TaxID=682080 RepID=A0A9P4R6L6_9PLEO|nr:hypothetical protein EJ04DRAFT_259127 [Polyplosphaeria fusca]